MARYSLIPVDGSAVIDGNAAFGINYSGINPAIHAVQWYGTEGDVEYVADFAQGIVPPPERITDITPYMPYVNQALAIIDAYQNPVIVYSTSDSTTYGGISYILGAEIVIDTPNPVPPAQSTPLMPPVPESWQELYWFNNAWVTSSFDPTLSLLQAKQFLIAAVETSAAQNVDNQARIYSVVELATAGVITDLPTADYNGIDLGEYQNIMDAEVASMTAQINAATTQSDLYIFNPNIAPNP